MENHNKFILGTPFYSIMVFMKTVVIGTVILLFLNSFSTILLAQETQPIIKSQNNKNSAAGGGKQNPRGITKTSIKEKEIKRFIILNNKEEVNKTSISQLSVSSSGAGGSDGLRKSYTSTSRKIFTSRDLTVDWVNNAPFSKLKYNDSLYQINTKNQVVVFTKYIDAEPNTHYVFYINLEKVSNLNIEVNEYSESNKLIKLTTEKNIVYNNGYQERLLFTTRSETRKLFLKIKLKENSEFIIKELLLETEQEKGY